MKKIGIFAGSSDLSIPFFKEEVERLADLLAEKSYQIVYGAGKVGLMGVLSQRYYAHKGMLIGVVPHYLNRSELVFEYCNELIVTKDLHDRKETMENLSDAFIVLPGGIGTMDEFLNVLASKQLKYHNKPLFLLNIDNFFEFVRDMIETMFNHRFIHDGHKHLYQCMNTPEELVEKLEQSFSLF
ncbi:MAG: TIGR00730 family Rossman fold protein [Candidatus Hydrogenedens sp.]